MQRQNASDLPPSDAVAPAEPATATTYRPRRAHPLRILASLRIAVTCLVAMTLLVFVGTLAQVDRGIFLVQKEYFESFFVWKQVSPTMTLPIMPGGYLIGGVFFVNLVAALFSRFTWRVGKLGILLIHLGVIVILLGELFTDLAAVEMQMVLDEGQTTTYTEDLWNTELALTTTRSDGSQRIVSIPPTMLVEQTSIEHPALPVTLRVVGFTQNAAIVRAEEVPANPATVGVGQQVAAVPIARATKMDERDVPAAYVTAIAGDTPMGTYLVSAAMRDSQPIVIDGQTWEIALRQKRRYYPFSLTLLDFTHERHEGTEIPSHFASRVRLVDPGADQDRETDIYMNHPLRYDGLTFYQASFANNDTTSIFQVVRNPSWLLPYVACVMIGVGMLVQFGLSLHSFRKRRAMA